MDGLPPLEAPFPDAYTECIVTAAGYYRVPPEIVATLLMVEGGRVGRTSANTNDTADMGPMQINTIHVPKFERMGVPKEALINNACVNIAAGTYILHNRLEETPRDPWRGVGNYHSKTPKYHRIYMRKVKDAYIRLLGQFGDYVQYLRRATVAKARQLQKQATGQQIASR